MAIWWLTALTLAAAHLNPTAHNGIASVRFVNQSIYPLAACLDGSAPAFYLRPATSAAASSKWVVYHEGGDFCGYGSNWDEWVEDCRERAHTSLGSSAALARNATLNLWTYGVDVFANDPESLVHDWNWVYMLYCDGHYYAGANASETIAPIPDSSDHDGAAAVETLYFRGKWNVEGVLGTIDLRRNASAAAVSDVLVHGCSSGGVAVFSNAEHVRTLLPLHARVASAANSGYYLNRNTEYWTRPPFLMGNLTGTLNRRCVESAAQKATPWNCIVAEVAAPSVRAMPIFAWQSQFDSNQLSCAQIDPRNRSAVNAYGNKLTASLVGWVDAAAAAAEEGVSIAPRGAFIDGCYRHCGCDAGIAAPDAAGVAWTPRSALRAWWTSLWRHSSIGSAAPSARSRVWAQSGAYPCAECCTDPAPASCT